MTAVCGNNALNDYEQDRANRIARNHERLAELGLLRQKTLLDACFQSVKRPNARSAPQKLKAKGLAVPIRSSQRVKGIKPEYKEVSIYADEAADGRIKLPTDVSGEVDSAWLESMKARRCNSKGRGSVYDNHAGITCHFCRQKKLCGEENCPRCSERDTEKECIGKSECSKCGSACGRFCRACLLVRYGQTLEEVREQMAAGTYLCPHCHEDEHPNEGWICNSSICMTRRGLKPTGIAIFDAQKSGFASVAHYVQAGILRRQGKAVPAPASAPPATQSSNSGCAAPAETTSSAATTSATQAASPAADASVPASDKAPAHASADDAAGASQEPWKDISEGKAATTGRKRKAGADTWAAGAAALTRRATTRATAAAKVQTSRRGQQEQ